MFRRKSRTLIEITRLSSLIAAGVEIEGDVYISDGLRIDGTVLGNEASHEFCRDISGAGDNSVVLDGFVGIDVDVVGAVEAERGWGRRARRALRFERAPARRRKPRP